MKNRLYVILKKKEYLYLGLVFLASLVSLKAQESSESLFTRGNTAYNEAKYSQAAELYEQIIKNGEHSAELYYNLGNTYYRLNQVAESIYFFEKAKQLAPKNQDIKINSSFAVIRPCPTTTSWRRSTRSVMAPPTNEAKIIGTATTKLI